MAGFCEARYAFQLWLKGTPQGNLRGLFGVRDPRGVLAVAIENQKRIPAPPKTPSRNC